jgi:arylsulfatase A-like enzyme
MVEKCAFGQNIYEDILNIPLIIKYPGKTEKGKRIGELVSNVDILPTLIELLELEVPDLKHPMGGESLVDVILNEGSLGREYIVSESWSQAAVITRDYKLGIMMDPTSARPELDYRDFGDMFFDMRKDPLEMENGINDPAYQEQIEQLRQYFNEFVRSTPSTGKDEMIRTIMEK